MKQYIYIYIYIYAINDCIFKLIIFKGREILKTHNKKYFRTGEVSWNEDTSINISSKTEERKALQGKVWDLFS